MAMRAGYKRHDELASWDLNASCRKYINQSTKSNRKLKKILRKQARHRLKTISF